MPGTEEITDTTGNTGGGDYTPPATQADLDRIITDRLARATAKFEGFEDFKAKAEKFDAIKEAPVADAAALAKVADLEARFAAAEAAAREATETATKTAIENARLAVATDKGISKEDLPLLTATTREALEVQADRILKLTSGSGRVPGQGGRDATGGSGNVSAGRELFESSRKKSTS